MTREAIKAAKAAVELEIEACKERLAVLERELENLDNRLAQDHLAKTLHLFT